MEEWKEESHCWKKVMTFNLQLSWRGCSKYMQHGLVKFKLSRFNSKLTKHHPEHSISKVKQVGVSSIMWCFSSNSNRRSWLERMNESKLRTIQERHLVERGSPSRRTNCPKHEPRATMKVKTFMVEWPSQSPGLNPSQNMRQDLKIVHHIINLAELEAFFKNKWAENSV